MIGFSSEWMTPELMQAIVNDHELLMGFQDPEIQKLMDQISKVKRQCDDDD